MPVAVDVDGASADESPIDYQLDPNGPLSGTQVGIHLTLNSLKAVRGTVGRHADSCVSRPRPLPRDPIPEGQIDGSEATSSGQSSAQDVCGVHDHDPLFFV